MIIIEGKFCCHYAVIFIYSIILIILFFLSLDSSADVNLSDTFQDTKEHQEGSSSC